MWGKIVISLCAVVYAGSAQELPAQSKVVQTQQGAVRGYRDPDTGIYSFLSIPYATTPTGPNKFKAPLPPPTWKQPLDAVDRSIGCPQPKLPFPGNQPFKFIEEDCLIASVYVPDTKQTKLPVLVYVHGGAFQVGSGDWLVPKTLAKENNIIIVTFNYRLGAHGFLCLGTEDIPGNAGMKDQVALLRWVNLNIHSFGGNPDEVTIEGYSAGSAAVDLLVLSKSASGLFSKVIAESGASTSVFAVQSDPLHNAKLFARTLNFSNVNDVYALEHFYKNLSLDDLIAYDFLEKTDSTFGFSPCVERNTGEEVFLDEPPVNIIKSGNYRKVPLLYGFANMEGLMRIEFFDIWKQKMNENFSDFLPGNMKFDSEKEKEEVAKVVKAFYFDDKPVSKDNILAYVDFFTDVIFAYPTFQSTKLHVEAGHNQIFLYEYSFVDSNTPVVPHTNVKGAKHCDQTLAVADKHGYFSYGVQEKGTEEFNNMSLIIRKIWSNFIKTGKPILEGSNLPTWPAVGANWSPYMSLSNVISLQKRPLLEQRMRFWDNLYAKYYWLPVAPSEHSRPPKIDL